LDKEEDVDVYSIDNFTFHTKNIEKQGQYFNPIMATLITASARLILSIAEKIADDKGYFAYCDTDSVFVAPDTVKDIQDFFNPLCPYSTPVQMFKIEEDERGNRLENVMFYGISAKRYCLYDVNNGKVNIRKYSSHGLGHLKGINGEAVWKAILTKDFSEFTDKIAISQITISKPSILQRFKKMNEKKPYEKQIKPFNFMLVGTEKNGIIPCLPFTKDIARIDCEPFIDYKTDTPSSNLPLPSYAYWHSLEDVLTSYVRHNDNKFDYDNQGIAHRKHINADKVRYIGKESNNLDEGTTIGVKEDDYTEYTKDREIVESEDFKQWILSFKPKDVAGNGISQQALYYQKSMIRNGKILNPKQKIVRKLLDLYKDIKLISYP